MVDGDVSTTGRLVAGAEQTIMYLPLMSRPVISAGAAIAVAVMGFRERAAEMR